MSTVNNNPEVLSSVPEIFGSRIQVINRAVYEMQIACAAMGIVEYRQPEYQAYVNPAPQTESTGSTVVYENMNSEPTAILRENIKEALAVKTAADAKHHAEDAQATIISLAEHRNNVAQAHDRQLNTPQVYYDQEIA